MAKERVFDVAPEQNRWLVRDTYELYPTTYHGTRAAAIDEGHRIAEARRSC